VQKTIVDVAVALSFVLLPSAVALAQGEPTAATEKAPAGSAPAANTPAEKPTADDTPAETAPADSAPAKTAAASSAVGTTPADKKPDEKKPDEKKSKEPSFAVVPGPFYNASLGLGVNVIPMLVFHPNKKDEVSPPSMAMLNLLYAIKPPFDDAGERQSFAGVAMTRLYLDEDRWRVVGVVGYVNMFQEFYGVGETATSHPQFNYRLEQVIAVAQVYRQVFWKGFYVGGLLGASFFHTKSHTPEDAAVLESIGSGSDWRVSPNVGLLSQYDSRNNKYYPSKGVYFNLRMNGSVFKEGEQYFLIAPGFNQYFPLLGGTDRLVLAYRVFGQFGWGNLPISAYARYGMRGTTLGYETGEYMDKKMAGVETEVRWIIWKRIGAEAGGGLGKVFSEFSKFPDAAWLPGVWGSGTFKIMEKQDVRARATVAYGKSGTLFYFAVGQNF
jgi:Omp85 superfamily domain